MALKQRTGPSDGDRAKNMAKASKKTLRAKTLGERFKPGKVSGWLPAVAAFLCLSMFAIAALVLFQVGSDPQSGPSPLPTSVSAQGFAGLRRVLEADGHTTIINRFEDGGPVERGDLEIITLDNSYSLFTGGYDALDQDESSSASESSQNSEASANAAGEGESASSASLSPDIAKILNDGVREVPDPKRVNHILYQPLGKAVLIVVPKWESNLYPRNRRWAQAPALTKADDIEQMLAIVSPVTVTETRYDDDGNVIRPAAIPGRRAHVGHDETITYDLVDYTIRRNTRIAPPKAKQPNPDNDPIIELQNKPDPDETVTAEVTLSPAPGQSVFTAPLKAGKIAALQSITGPNLVPVLVTADGQPVLSRVIVTGGRKPTTVPVYVLSDPDLLNNQILAEPQKVITALQLIEKITPMPSARSAPGAQSPSSSVALGQAKIVYNMTFNGLSFDRDLLHTLSRPPFLAVPLAMLILGLALMWAAFARFGPAETAPAGPPLGRGVRTLADNAARLMAITLKETKLGPAYAILVRDMVIKGRGYMQVDPGQSLDDLAERIGKTHGATDSYLDLRDRAARVVTVHHLIDVTLKLHAWKTEIERAHI